MDQRKLDWLSSALRLDQAETWWTVLKQLHGGSTDKKHGAWEWFSKRYGRAIHAYLLAALKDAHAADDLYQRLATKIGEGKFRNVNPNFENPDAEVGPFRKYLIKSLGHLLSDHWNQQKRIPAPLPASLEVQDSTRPPLEQLAEAEQAVNKALRAEVLEEAWHALEHEEMREPDDERRFLYKVFRCRVDHQELRAHHVADMLARTSPKIAAKLKGKDEKRRGQWVRNTLVDARATFAQYLIKEVAWITHPPSAENVIAELIELDLYQYCREYLGGDSG